MKIKFGFEKSFILFVMFGASFGLTAFTIVTLSLFLPSFSCVLTMKASILIGVIYYIALKYLYVQRVRLK